MSGTKKYSLKEKLSIVRSVLSGGETMQSAASKMGGHKKSVQCWVGLYNHYGAAGLRSGRGKYSGRFKVKVIKHMLKKDLSLSETTAFFGIAGSYTVGCWLRVYERDGEIGLQQMTRGRKKGIMSKKPRKNSPKNTASPEEQLAALKSENEYLRAENAFLKKLDALVREEKAAKKQNRQQKPSKN